MPPACLDQPASQYIRSSTLSVPSPVLESVSPSYSEQHQYSPLPHQAGSESGPASSYARGYPGLDVGPRGPGPLSLDTRNPYTPNAEIYNSYGRPDTPPYPHDGPRFPPEPRCSTPRHRIQCPMYRWPQPQIEPLYADARRGALTPLACPQHDTPPSQPGFSPPQPPPQRAPSPHARQESEQLQPHIHRMRETMGRMPARSGSVFSPRDEGRSILSQYSASNPDGSEARGAERPVLSVLSPGAKESNAGGDLTEPNSIRHCPTNASQRSSSQSHASNASVVLPPPISSASSGPAAGAFDPAAPSACQHPTLPRSNSRCSNAIDIPLSVHPTSFIWNQVLPSPSSLYSDWNSGSKEDNMRPGPLDWATQMWAQGHSF